MNTVPQHEIRTKHLFRLELSVGTPHLMGKVPTGERRPTAIHGGSFAGERLNGIVLGGGNDWILIRNDGVWEIDVRIPLIADDNEPISMAYKGFRHGPPDVLAQIARGERVDPASYYFRTAVTFETSSEKYAWLNRLIAIGFGYREPEGPRYDVFEVL